MPLLYEETETIFAPDTYKEAVAEAARIGQEKGIQMVVEALEPAHLGWSAYRLPVGDTFVNLKDNIIVYPTGIFSTDPDFDSMAWWEGAKTEYLYDWFTKPVAATLEKTMTMFPQPVFKAGSFAFEVNSSVPKAFVDAWITGYVVLPKTSKGMSIKR